MDHIEERLGALRRPWSDRAFGQGLPFSATSPQSGCTLFCPLHYEPRYAYPLLVWLHGRGSDEGQLKQIMPQVSLRNFVAVAPRGTAVARPQGATRCCYGWKQAAEQIQRAEQRVFESIEMVQQRYHVAPRRIFLAGFGSGGTMAFRVGLRNPERFAGVLSLCGPLPRVGGAPLGNLLQARRLSFFLAVGRDSQRYPTAEVCSNLRLFHSAGLSVTLRQYPCKGKLIRQMLLDMNQWIMDQLSPAENTSCQFDDPLSPERDG